MAMSPPWSLGWGQSPGAVREKDQHPHAGSAGAALLTHPLSPRFTLLSFFIER